MNQFIEVKFNDDNGKTSVISKSIITKVSWKENNHTDISLLSNGTYTTKTIDEEYGAFIKRLGTDVL